YNFISRSTVEQILEDYVNSLLVAKHKKALINHELLNKIKNVLMDPKNTSLYNKNMRVWAKKRFQLEEIVSGDYRVIVKATNNPVLITENKYEILCQQDIIEQFVNHCTICAVQKLTFHPLAAKPIIAKNFLSHLQVKALTSKRAIEVAAYLFDLVHMIRSSSVILQSDNGKEFCAEVIKELIKLWPSLGKWKEETGRSDWSFGLRLVITTINSSWYQSHKKTPYELVYGMKPCGNCVLVNDLFERNICDEEEIPDTIDIQCDSDTNLDDDMDNFPESLFQELNDAERNSESLYLQLDNDDNSL
ncbi:10211_t:CDS:2, partial [Scutellospora calospora]